MVTVIFEPAYTQDDDVVIAAVNLLIASVEDVARLEVTLAPLRALAVKYIVPLSVATVLYVKIMLPDAPDASVSGLPAVAVKAWVTVPVLNAVGGLGFDTMPLCDAVELFFTVMTRLKLLPAAIAVTGFNKVSVIWNEVIDNDNNFHKLEVLEREKPLRLNFGPVVVLVKLARIFCRLSLRSVAAERITKTRVKFAVVVGPFPLVAIALFHEVA
jgi:hypothetical protein